VTSIRGQAATENPSSFPDITINTLQPVPMVITGCEVPLGTVPMLTILRNGADQDALPCPGGLAGTLATSTCTMNITFPIGGSRRREPSNGSLLRKWFCRGHLIP